MEKANLNLRKVGEEDLTTSCTVLNDAAMLMCTHARCAPLGSMSDYGDSSCESHGLVQDCVEARQRRRHREHGEGGGQDIELKKATECVQSVALAFLVAAWVVDIQEELAESLRAQDNAEFSQTFAQAFGDASQGSLMERHLIWTRLWSRPTRPRRPFISRTRPARRRSPTSWRRQPCGTRR